MITYISILRGINVSGQKLIKMKALQEMYENLGLRRVRTYIQSGNVVFESEHPGTGQLQDLISAGILKSFGFEVPVIVMDREYLEHVSENNLFISDRKEDISRLHVTFLSGEPEKGLSDAIKREDFLPDEFVIAGKAVYLFCPGGYGNTKLSNTFFEKRLKVRATTRNWKTVLELVSMSRDQGT